MVLFLSKRVWEFPNCGAENQRSIHFSEKNFSQLCENRMERLRRQGRRLCPRVKQRGTVRLAHGIAACKTGIG